MAKISASKFIKHLSDIKVVEIVLDFVGKPKENIRN